MKKFLKAALFVCCLLLSSCMLIPGYVNPDGTITPPYDEQVVVKAQKGNITLNILLTDHGIQHQDSLNSGKATPQKSQSAQVQEGSSYTFSLRGNYSTMIAVRATTEDAVFSIEYKNQTEEFTIHSSDVTDKIVYLKNL